MKTNVLTARCERFISSHSADREERIRFIVFFTGALQLTIFTLLNIIGAIGIRHHFLQAVAFALLALCISMVVLYLRRTLTLIQSFTVFAISAQLLEMARIGFLALAKPQGYEAMIHSTLPYVGFRAQNALHLNGIKHCHTSLYHILLPRSHRHSNNHSLHIAQSFYLRFGTYQPAGHAGHTTRKQKLSSHSQLDTQGFQYASKRIDSLSATMSHQRTRQQEHRLTFKPTRRAIET